MPEEASSIVYLPVSIWLATAQESTITGNRESILSEDLIIQAKVLAATTIDGQMF